MPTVKAKPDTLNEINKRFEQKPLTHPVFLNSVPKCGTHLIRNIFRMFVMVEQQYHDTFIQYPNLGQHLKAFQAITPRLSWGHLLFSDNSAIATADAVKLIIVRDPYDWVLARARFFLSDNFDANLEHLKTGDITTDQLLNMMIFGIHQKVPTLSEIYTHNAVSWLAEDIKLVRYEELVKHLKQLDTDEAEAYFTDLLTVTGWKSLPADWRERVQLGADRKQSGTARENLQNVALEIPDELPQRQKDMVDFAVPGLRRLLGYE